MLLFPKTAVRWHWPRDLISETPLDGRPNSRRRGDHDTREFFAIHARRPARALGITRSAAAVPTMRPPDRAARP